MSKEPNQFRKTGQFNDREFTYYLHLTCELHSGQHETSQCGLRMMDLHFGVMGEDTVASESYHHDTKLTIDGLTAPAISRLSRKGSDSPTIDVDNTPV